MTLARLNDWQSRLAVVMADYAHRPFVRGVSDCCTFAGAAVHAVCGRETLVPFGAWLTDREALRKLRGGGGMRVVMGTVLGAEIVSAMAQTGDVAMFMEGEQEALAVYGGEAWHCTASNGLAMVDPAQLIVAWRCCGEPA